jgi:hypothetical protein
MIWVGRVEEREFRIRALILANFVLELRRIGGTGNEECRSVNNGCRS